MKHYNIAFIGVGSIGKRHLLNVCSLLEARGDTFSIDLYRSNLSRKLPETILTKVNKQILYNHQLENSTMYDVVFVTNPTSMHRETVRKFASHTKSFFIEKPVFDSNSAEDEDLIEQIKDIISYVACPLRYTPALQYVKNHVDVSKALAVRAISSSFLPDWRPGQDYRKCYSAHRDMGGGVGIDLIHEWDYITLFWGLPQIVFSIQNHISSLEIDSDDIAIYIARSGNTTIELHLDYFGRSVIRSLEIYMPDDTIRCDIENGKIEYLKEGKVIKLDTERNDYQLAEIQHFFDILDGETEDDSTIEHACNVLKLAKGKNI